MSQTLTLTSPPDRDSLISTLLEITFWTAAWFGIFFLTKITLAIPAKIAKEENPKKREFQIVEYVTNYLSLYHAIFLVLTSSYCFLMFPNVRNRPFTQFEKFLVKSSLGYLFYDTIIGLKAGVNDIWMNIHHVVMLTSYGQGLY